MNPSPLSTAPLFHGLPERHLNDLEHIAVEREYDRGELVFAEGDEANGFYVLHAGRVKIYKVSFEGKEQILHIFGPGEPFGEVPVFTGEHFPANAEALEKAAALFFPREAFIALVKRNPELALNLLAILSVRLRRFAALIDDLSLKEVPGRLAAHLLYLSERKQGALDLELDVAKGQLASLLGTIPETLSRILGRLKKGGFIDLTGPRIRLLDVEGLQELAEGGQRL